MKTTDNDLQIFKLLSSFFNKHLIAQRKCSPDTIRNYKNSLKQFRLFLRDVKGVSFHKITFDSFSRNNIYDFCEWLFDEKNCSVATVNNRLSALLSFLKYCSAEDISLTSVYLEAKKIKRYKKIKPNVIKYLSEEQLKKAFAAPDTATKKGRRNQYLMIHAYETGGRVGELMNLKLKDIIFSDEGVLVHFFGKGGKERIVPLADEAVPHLSSYLNEFHPDGNGNDYFFYTVHNGIKTRMSPRTVNEFLAGYSDAIQATDSSFPRLHAHIFRHSIAMTMLREGIPLPIIGDFLGHASLDSTAIYAHADIRMMREALEKVHSININGITITEERSEKEWTDLEDQLIKICGLK